MNKSLWVIALIFLLVSCSTPVLLKSNQSIDLMAPIDGESGDDNRWYAVRFVYEWDQDSDPDFYIDTILADRVIAPLLNRYQSHIVYWRVHRRAAPDEAGHRFSFILYTNKDIYERVIHDVNEDELVELMLSSGRLKKVRFVNDRKSDELALVSGMSDSSWNVEIQNTWPIFIMGVSRSWLSLIQEVRASSNALQEEDTTFSNMLEAYKAISKTVDELWAKQGAHAYLHHLNAIFGYEPVMVPTPSMWQRF